MSELRSRGWRAGDNLVLLPQEDPEAIHPTGDEAREALRAWQRQGVDLVVAFSTPFAQLLADEAPSTPGLFLVNDPVAAGLVSETERPEGSLTGVTFRTPADRTLDLASRMMGGLTTVGYLAPADDAAVPGHRDAVSQAAEELGLGFVAASFAGGDEVPAAVDALVAGGADVVFLATSTNTIRVLEPIEQELRRVGLPAVANTDFATFAVVVLTPDGVEVRRQLARQAARLLSGAPVSAVPVEDPRKFLLIVNASQMETLGFPAPSDDLLREADVVR
ncbi:MAG: ABC transporter substrate binding protein [Nitriliruptorales bacterium]|nr:ABC transporter substrate binding protein [Nitriliruptorales bacterium]